MVILRQSNREIDIRQSILVGRKVIIALLKLETICLCQWNPQGIIIGKVFQPNSLQYHKYYLLC